MALQGTEAEEENKGREFRRPVFHRRQAVEGASKVVPGCGVEGRWCFDFCFKIIETWLI